jgi:hypothetical protein
MHEPPAWTCDRHNIPSGASPSAPPCLLPRSTCHDQTVAPRRCMCMLWPREVVPSATQPGRATRKPSITGLSHDLGRQRHHAAERRFRPCVTALTAHPGTAQESVCHLSWQMTGVEPHVPADGHAVHRLRVSAAQQNPKPLHLCVRPIGDASSSPTLHLSPGTWLQLTACAVCALWWVVPMLWARMMNSLVNVETRWWRNGKQHSASLPCNLFLLPQYL